MSLEFGVLQASSRLSTIPWSPSLGWLGDSSWWFQPGKVLSKSQNAHLAPSEIHQKNWKPPSNDSLAAFSACLFLLLHVLWVKVLLILTASFIRYPNGGCFFFVCRTCHGSPISHKSSQIDGPWPAFIWYLWNGFREGSFGCAIFFGCFEKGFCCCTLSSTLTGNGKCIHHFFGNLRGNMDKNGDLPASNVFFTGGYVFFRSLKTRFESTTMFLANSEILHVKKYRRGTTLGPFGSFGPSFGKRKNSWMLKRGVIGTPQVATQLLFCKNWIWMKNQLPFSGDFTRRPFLFRFDSVCFTSFPMGVLGSEFVLKKLSQTNELLLFGWEIASNLQQKTVTGHHPASLIAILEVLRSNIWWTLLDTKTPEQHKISI